AAHRDRIVTGAAQERPVNSAGVQNRVVAGRGIEGAAFNAGEIDAGAILRIAGELPLDEPGRLVQSVVAGRAVDGQAVRAAGAIIRNHDAGGQARTETDRVRVRTVAAAEI